MKKNDVTTYTEIMKEIMAQQEGSKVRIPNHLALKVIKAVELQASKAKLAKKTEGLVMYDRVGYAQYMRTSKGWKRKKGRITKKRLLSATIALQTVWSS